MNKATIEVKESSGYDYYDFIRLNGVNVPLEDITEAYSDMIDASINLLSELKDQKLSPDAWVYYNELEEALKKAGCE